ncbi:MAG: tetratricopeptide repeat protein, partial [Tepidisphaeraceae bacterium]
DYNQRLNVVASADIALDSFPYHGTTTTCETLWMSVPWITLAGDRHASRVGVSILRNVGLDDLIATSEADYIEKSVALAGDPARLARLRNEIRQRMRASALLDAEVFCRNLDSALRDLWSRWCRRGVA